MYGCALVSTKQYLTGTLQVFRVVLFQISLKKVLNMANQKETSGVYGNKLNKLPSINVERAKPSRGPPRIKEEINTTTFPLVLSRVMLKSNVPPAPPKDDIWAYTQYLCFLYLEKPGTRKRVYHMFLSNEKDLQVDYDGVRKIYENRKDIKIVNQLSENTLCARTLYRKVQKAFSDAVWNKKGNVFEIEMIAETDIWAISRRLNAMRKEDDEKLFNYIKFLTVTSN